MSGWYPDPSGRSEYRYHNDEPVCRVLSVNGAPPFGLDPERFE